MMKLADKLATNSVEHSNKSIIATCNDEVPQRERSCLKDTVNLNRVSKGLDPFHARKSVFIDPVFEIGYKQELAIMVQSRIAAIDT